jgi:alkylation response protein AidB-like acyl-CoA dehydrogenase
MQFELDDQDQQFRAQVRDFIRGTLPLDIVKRRRRSGYNAFKIHEDMLHWTALLDSRGWAVPHWPQALGGTNWTPMQHFIFQEEQWAADCPSQNVQGVHLVGPIVYLFGNEEQKQRFLPRIRQGRDYWCQGFSEPGAGSDLASLCTAAVLQGDTYVVNGQKIWTSGAAGSDWGFFLVRTDNTGKKQEGISFLLIKMDTPGISVRTIPAIHGDNHLCEVFLNNVEVPVENLIGEAGKGWGYAKELLQLERVDSSFIYATKREVARLRELALREGLLGDSTRRSHAVTARIARVEALAQALEWSVLRVLGKEKRSYGATPVASALKLRGAELQQLVTELYVDLLGNKGIRHFGHTELETWVDGRDDYWHDEVPGRTFSMLYCRAATIFGGARQVQSNIIAKTAFGL